MGEASEKVVGVSNRSSPQVYGRLGRKSKCISAFSSCVVCFAHFFFWWHRSPSLFFNLMSGLGTENSFALRVVLL